MKNWKMKIIFAIVAMFCVGCEKAENYEGLSLNNAKIYTNWGASKNAVTEFMEGYTLNNEDGDYLYFSKQGTSHIISYAFQNGELQTCLLMINQEKESDSAINQFLTNCTEVGAIDEKIIYLNEGKNMLVTCGVETDNNISYTTLGLTQLN